MWFESHSDPRPFLYNMILPRRFKHSQQGKILRISNCPLLTVVLDGYEVMQKLGDYRHSWGLMAIFAHSVRSL